MQLARLRQEYNKNPIYRVLYLFIGFYRFVRTVTWAKAKVEKPLNRLAWQKWSAQISIPTKGYYEIWARAIDSQGNSQPMVLAQWNPGGYINNACHRVNVYGV